MHAGEVMLFIVMPEPDLMGSRFRSRAADIHADLDVLIREFFAERELLGLIGPRSAAKIHVVFEFVVVIHGIDVVIGDVVHIEGDGDFGDAVIEHNRRAFAKNHDVIVLVFDFVMEFGPRFIRDILERFLWERN